MKRILDVYLNRDLVGNLVQDEHGQMTFDYSESWLGNLAAIPLSHSLPLSRKHFTQNESRGFFAGILPEESKRDVIARNLGISARNDFAMLERIGGECAGAVTFILSGNKLPKQTDSYRTITEKELADILRALPRRPLMAGEDGVRLSLAGAQDKIAVYVSEGQIAIPLDGSPSTHILKPSIEHFEGVVFNEAFCMKLAREVGLDVANVEIGKVEEIDYLLVERYDRTMSSDVLSLLKRVHQEDFCQALGIVPERKYQAEGGPSLKQCFELLRETSSAPVIDLQGLFDAVIFNFLIGNNDAHGKNFSLLYHGEKQTRLAPLYDLLSTAYYPELSQKMAMKIGGESVFHEIFPKHFERLAEEAGLAKPIVKRRVLELAEMIRSKISAVAVDHATSAAVAVLIEGRCERALQNFRG